MYMYIDILIAIDKKNALFYLKIEYHHTSIYITTINIFIYFIINISS